MQDATRVSPIRAEGLSRVQLGCTRGQLGIGADGRVGEGGREEGGGWEEGTRDSSLIGDPMAGEINQTRCN